MNHKLVPTLLTEPMSEVLRNEHCVYQTEQELYNALLEAAPDVPVGLEPVAYMAPTGTCVKAGYVSYTPNWTDYYTTPLVSQSAAAAVIAAKDAEIERLKEERLGVISQSNMHPSWLEKSREEILDCLRFQGSTTALLLAETADLRKHLAAAERMLSLFVNVADSWLLATANDRAKYAEARQRTVLAFKQTDEEMKVEES